jgi:hypothetical protein
MSKKETVKFDKAPTADDAFERTSVKKTVVITSGLDGEDYSHLDEMSNDQLKNVIAKSEFKEEALAAKKILQKRK